MLDAHRTTNEDVEWLAVSRGGEFRAVVAIAPISTAVKMAARDVNSPRTPWRATSARQRFSVPVAGVRSDDGHTLATLVSYLVGPSTSELAPV